MELYKTIAPDKSIQKHVLFGGMPYLANIQHTNEPLKQYFHHLFNSVQWKDIVICNKIRDINLWERIIAYVMANVGNTFSASSLAKY